MINNRDLSWLNFNNRVLQEAQDKTVPLLQRLRFLGIFSNNLDEFIKVRVANVIRLSQIKGKKVPLFSGNYTPRDLLIKIKPKIAESQLKFDKIYNEIILEMEEHGIYMLNEKQLTKKQEAYCRDYFSRIISPRLVPLIIRKRTAIPFLTDSNIYHAVKMQNKNKEDTKYAIIQIPVSNNCPRFIELPSEKGLNDIIFLDDIIRLCLDHIFFMFNYTEISAYTFKLTRDALLTVDDDVSKSLIEKMEDGLENRMHGQPVRLIYDKEMPEDLLGIIISKLLVTISGTPLGILIINFFLFKYLVISTEIIATNIPGNIPLASKNVVSILPSISPEFKTKNIIIEVRQLPIGYIL